MSRTVPVKGFLKLTFDENGRVVKGQMHGSAAMKFYDVLIKKADEKPKKGTNAG